MIPVNPQPIRHSETFTEKYLKLDSSWGWARLQEREFKKLFAKCTCRLVMTTRVFQDHECAVAVVPHTVIDLTSDNDNKVLDLTEA